MLLLVVTIISCKVTWVPSADDQIKAQVTQGMRTTDSVYDVMIVSSDKTYSSHTAGYDLIAQDIDNLYHLEEARNSTIASQVKILQTHFIYYRSQHQTKGTLNKGQLETYKNDLDAFWKPIINSENFLK